MTDVDAEAELPPADHPVPVPGRIIFSGRVQGVGFRYRTKSIARLCGAFGTVRNLPDGTVELCLAEPVEPARRLVRELRTAMAGQIDHIRVEPWTPAGPIRDFRIIR